jgi:hypothetical protein
VLSISFWNFMAALPPVAGNPPAVGRTVSRDPYRPWFRRSKELPMAGNPFSGWIVMAGNPGFGFVRRADKFPVAADDYSCGCPVGLYPYKIGSWFRGPRLSAGGKSNGQSKKSCDKEGMQASHDILLSGGNCLISVLGLQGSRRIFVTTYIGSLARSLRYKSGINRGTQY